MKIFATAVPAGTALALALLLILATDLVGGSWVSTLGRGLGAGQPSPANAVADVRSGSALAAPETTIGGPFELVAPEGTTVSDKDFQGKWLIVFFGYTFCPDVCPTTLAEIALALEALGPEATLVQPLFITVDPQRDTPEVMGDYAAAFDPRILGLSGSQAQIDAVSEAYGAYGARRGGGGDYLMDHSTYIYIMDPQGRFAEGLQYDATGDEIAGTVLRLMRTRGPA